MRYTVDYSRFPPGTRAKEAAAIDDIITYLGADRFERLSIAFLSMPDLTEDAMHTAVCIAGIQGYPVTAWHSLILRLCADPDAAAIELADMPLLRLVVALGNDENQEQDAEKRRTMTTTQPEFIAEEFSLSVTQRPHKGHDRPAVEQNTTVYIVRHVRTQRVFSYAYLHRDAAEAIAAKISAEWLDLDNSARVRLLDGNYRRADDGFIPIVSALEASKISPYVSHA